MQLYRFSPIQSSEELFKAIEYIHFACFALCKQSFGRYLPIAGNVGVFCHYDDEFELLINIRIKLTKPSNNPNQKYFELYKPIIIKAKGDVPKTIYTHLYIRKPDPYRYHVGDIDFYLEQDKYNTLKKNLLLGKKLEGARVFERVDLDMIELYNPDIDVLAYVSTKIMSTKVRIKLSDATKL